MTTTSNADVVSESTYQNICGFVFSPRLRPSVDDLVTRLLENTLQDLEGLRGEIERLRAKSIHDVRDVNNLPVLRGVEERIEYPDLLGLIAGLKDGIAWRRLNVGAGDVAA